ncbi:Alpha/Beta hydrolase protein [Fennellomyces sp. T-0311]|nr:Alpha/Beta hydrolase protein [Fennellomyces sp. T-0311]
MDDIEPFTVPSFTPEQLAFLKDKLSKPVYPNELEEDYKWDYGAPTWAVKPLAEEWLGNYDWEKPRTKMNRWHHYHTTIDGLKVHFVHEPSSNPDAIPIMLVHGWPSTFYEFHKVIEPLRDGANGEQAFHVVVPSLPGFGFSEAPKVRGHGVAKNAEILNALMVKLGYTEYVLQGGDWGGIIGKYMASRYNANCKAFHTGFPMFLPPLPTPRTLLFYPFKLVKFGASLLLGFDRIYGAGKTIINGATFANAEMYDGCGYRAIQGTRPYTLAYGLTDSPLGLMAWMLEKYHDWTYHTPAKRDTEALPPTLTSEDFLTQVSIYWLTNTMSSSIRIYYECLRQKEMFKVVFGRPKVPVAVCAFAHDLIRLPPDWLEAASDLHQYSEYESGGHFPAMEENELLMRDVQRFGKILKDKKLVKS